MHNAIFLFLAGLAAADHNWPQFRGPRGDGHANARNLPIRWSEQHNVRWKTAIGGKAWASPVVWGERLWLSNATAAGADQNAFVLLGKERIA